MGGLGGDISLGGVLDATDSSGVDALAAAAPRIPGVRVWLLAESESEDAQRAGVRLRGAGVSVSLVSLPLAPPEARP